MYRTIEERLQLLEQTVEKQAFQIRLLQSLVENHEQYKLYQHVISSGMSERCFEKLKRMTAIYEQKVNFGENVPLHEFIRTFERVLAEDGIALPSSFISEFIPKWLSGTMGSRGFSPKLHAHFYK